MPSPAVDPRFADPAWCEAEYNPRILVPDAGTLYSQWPGWALASRARLNGLLDLPYGEDPRNRFDLFRADDPRGCLVFFHGGYWRAFSKDDFSWIADALVPAGYSVLVPSYPLCPQLSVGQIAAHCREALHVAWRDHLLPAERARLVVSGHSAGGYLTAAMFATDWTSYGLPADPLAGGLSISGVFALAPLIATSMNGAIGLDGATAEAFSLPGQAVRCKAPLDLAVGAAESAEFHRQSAVLAAAWPQICAAPRAVPGRNHFDVIEELRLPGSPLLTRCLALLG